MKSMEQMQREVDEYISQFKAGYFSPLAKSCKNDRRSWRISERN